MPDRKEKKKWSEMTRGQQTAAVALGILQVAVLVVAVVDLSRRPASQVRGKKAWWYPAMGINFFGPVAYLVVGRRPVPAAVAAPDS